MSEKKNDQKTYHTGVAWRVVEGFLTAIGRSLNCSGRALVTSWLRPKNLTTRVKDLARLAPFTMMWLGVKRCAAGERTSSDF
jgi:hypothetical protein